MDAREIPVLCSSKRRKTQEPSCNGRNNAIGGGKDTSSQGKGEADKDLNLPGVEASASSSLKKPWLSSNLWLEDHDLCVGLYFKDFDELNKAVRWCSIRGSRRCVVRETARDVYMFECITRRCKWTLSASRMDETHGMFEVTKYTGPHSCGPIEAANFGSVYAADEIECLVREHPTISIAELKHWWTEKFGYELESKEMQAAKLKAIRKIFGDWDESFRVIPKLMAALHSSNGLLVDWQYDVFPNPDFATFRGVFWAFSQSVKGFEHCRPLMTVETIDMKGPYSMKLMIASGMDAEGDYFPLAFAVTKEVSSDIWRWFLTQIREKVTQRKGLCLISSPHPDILAVINEPGSQWKEPWAYHRFCLNHLSHRFYSLFRNASLKNHLFEAASTSQQQKFDSFMGDIEKANPEARKWLDAMPRHQWALVYDGGRRYGSMTAKLDSMSADFQSLSLCLPVTATVLLLFDELRVVFGEASCLGDGFLKFGEMYSQFIMVKLEAFVAVTTRHNVMPLDQTKGSFQVVEPSNRWIVQLSDCTCTCGIWQAFKYPCSHALAVCDKLKLNALQYIDGFYAVEHYCQTYAATFAPVPKLSASPEMPILFPPAIVPQPRAPPGSTGPRAPASTGTWKLRSNRFGTT